MANNQQHVRPKPANMPSKQPTTNSSLPDRLYGEHYPDSFLDVPRPVRQSSVATLGDYIKHLQEVDRQSNQSNIANQSCKHCFGIGYDASGQRCECVDNPNFQHPCPNNPILTCNCGNPNDCVELGNDPDNNHVDGNKQCPDSGKVCNERTCPGQCKGDGFSDNLDYVHIEGQPIPTSPKGKATVSGWPCVVVGAIPETGVHATECISGLEHSEGDTERDTNARPESDGSYVSTNH